MSLKVINIGIIGIGSIFNSYLKIIKLNKRISLKAISSRTESKLISVSKKHKIPKVYTNYKLMIEKENLDAVFILVSADQIFKVTKSLLKYQIPLLIEKPPGLSLEETSVLADLSKRYNTKNMVGLNRRFYSNFHKGIEVINKYGGIQNIIIEGHERFWKIKDNVTKKQRETWIYGNGIHNIDLLRFFGGEIKSIKTIKKNKLEKNGDQFLSLINFKRNISGVYIANWYSPGGWSVKLLGEGVTVVFQPLENAYYMKQDMKKIYLTPSKFDKIYKPGLYKQILAFLDYVESGNINSSAQTLNDVKKTISLIKKISY